MRSVIKAVPIRIIFEATQCCILPFSYSWQTVAISSIITSYTTIGVILNIIQDIVKAQEFIIVVEIFSVSIGSYIRATFRGPS